MCVISVHENLLSLNAPCLICMKESEFLWRQTSAPYMYDKWYLACYVSMQDNYVDMQDNYVNMFKSCYMST